MILSVSPLLSCPLDHRVDHVFSFLIMNVSLLDRHSDFGKFQKISLL
jgi:hypothetical protein